MKLCLLFSSSTGHGLPNLENRVSFKGKFLQAFTRTRAGERGSCHPPTPPAGGLGRWRTWKPGAEQALVLNSSCCASCPAGSGPGNFPLPRQVDVGLACLRGCRAVGVAERGERLQAVVPEWVQDPLREGGQDEVPVA